MTDWCSSGARRNRHAVRRGADERRIAGAEATSSPAGYPGMRSCRDPAHRPDAVLVVVAVSKAGVLLVHVAALSVCVLQCLVGLHQVWFRSPKESKTFKMYTREINLSIKKIKTGDK